jgi:hypothetical protein
MDDSRSDPYVLFDESSQLDIILPFLGSVSTDTFLDMRTYERGNSALVALPMYAAAGSSSQQTIRSVLIQIIKRTIDHPSLLGKSSHLLALANMEIQDMQIPIISGVRGRSGDIVKTWYLDHTYCYCKTV